MITLDSEPRDIEAAAEKENPLDPPESDEVERWDHEEDSWRDK